MRRPLGLCQHPSSCAQRFAPWLVLLATSVACDPLSDLRAFLRSEDHSAGDLGQARLRVEVDPADGITILLDGVRVARESPYVNEHLPAGAHTLEVRAKGYHPFLLLIQLVDHQLVSIPVALRRRPKGKKASQPSVVPPRQPPPPPAPPRTLAPEVPAGVKSIALKVVVRPTHPVALDGVPVTGRTLTLTRVHGRITVASVELSYRIADAGLLFFTLPDDGATWKRGGKPAPPGSQFKHHRGVVQLERRDAAGKALTLLLKR